MQRTDEDSQVVDANLIELSRQFRFNSLRGFHASIALAPRRTTYDL